MGIQFGRDKVSWRFLLDDIFLCFFHPFPSSVFSSLFFSPKILKHPLSSENACDGNASTTIIGANKRPRTMVVAGGAVCDACQLFIAAVMEKGRPSKSLKGQKEIQPNSSPGDGSPQYKTQCLSFSHEQAGGLPMSCGRNRTIARPVLVARKRPHTPAALMQLADYPGARSRPGTKPQPLVK